MTHRATGTFEVKLTPQESAAIPARMSLEKQFHGDLEASSQGQMLAAGTNVKGSAGYVAIEQVSGTLHGRRGTFILQHHGLLTRGEAQLSVTVIPDSGAEELQGLSGTMTIQNAAGQHSYEFDYTLP